MENEKIFELMEKMYAEMQNGFKKVDERLNNLEKGQLKLEEIEKKVDLALEGHKANTEQLNRIEKEVSKHEEFILKRVK